MVLSIILALLAMAGIAFYRSSRSRVPPTVETAPLNSADDWERFRLWFDEILSRRAGSSLVLITGYRVASRRAGDLLAQRLMEQWRDKVELVWHKAPGDSRWVVVTTSETTLVTPILGRQWLARTRMVCEREGCRVSHLEVYYGGAPPTLAPLGVNSE
jgi:hypothetical protein